MTQRIGIALSGGADSAIAASLLRSRGCHVLGVHLLMTHSDEALLQAENARIVASRLGIDFELLDVAATFDTKVIAPFCQEYAGGATPNPCVTCNRDIKFGLLLRSVLARGVEKLATGHYARITAHGDRYLLQRAVDLRADQSYFLYALPASSLPYLEMPLGAMYRSEVKTLASQQGLVRSKSSQDICFIGGRDYRDFVAERVHASPGHIVDTTGKVLGRHRGLPFYTVGQRHGLGLALGAPRYVIRLDPLLNRIVVGDAESLMVGATTLRNLTWLIDPPPDGEILIHARARYRTGGTAARVLLRQDQALVHFAEPQRAVAPGQSIVFCDGDTVWGGGTIVASHREPTDAETDCSPHLR